MAQPKITTIIRQLGLSKTLAEMADQKAAQFGLSTPEYLRHLIVQDNQDRLDRVFLSPKVERQLLHDLITFLASEKTSPAGGATSAEELIAQLDRYEAHQND